MTTRLLATSLLATVLVSTVVSAQSSIIIPEFKRSTQVFEQNYRTWETAMADLDSDGDLDAVFTSLGPATMILFNDGKGYFEASEQEFPENIHGVAIGDIDLDGDNDLFLAPLSNNQPSPVYLNNGRGVFERSNPDLSVASSEKVQLFDIEGDGDLDAFLWWKSLLYINDGKGIFKKSSSVLSELSSFSDLNGDGFIDMIDWNRRVGFTIYLNDKKGDFVKHSFLAKSDLNGGDFGFADIDNDGDIDVIFSNGNEEEQGPAGVLLNDGTGRFTDSGQELSSVQYGYIGTGDLNNDGFIDIIITDRENPATIWMNNGKGEFFDSGITLGEGGFWHNCIIRDIDNDEDMDVFITKLYKGSHGLWFNQLIESKHK